MATKYPNGYIADNLNWKIGQQRDLILGHDHVHPERDVCGGVGGCLMLRAEVDIEVEIQNHLLDAYRRGYEVKVTLTRVKKSATS